MKLKYPEAPFPRSALAPLEPIGQGSPRAESVESYVLRLAQEHRVTRYHIEFVVSEAGAAPLYQGTSRQPFRVDSPSASAKAFARRLAMLTCVPAVETMGLGWLAGKVAFMGALRDHRAWCPQCIGKAQASGSDAYLPLAWSLPSYEICTDHGGSIHSSCPSCSKRIDVRREWAFPFTHCPHCARSLGRPESTAGNSLRDMERRKLRVVDQRGARYLGELISAAPEVRTVPMLDSPDLSRLVASAIARKRADNSSKLASLAGIPKSTLHGLAVTRTSRPSLDILARLSVAADVSIVGTLCPSLWKVGSDTDETRIALPLSPRRERPRLSWDEIRREANAQMRLTRPESLHALARRLHVDATHLKKTLPKTVARLADLHQKGVVAEREATQTKLATRMREFMDGEAERGKRISFRALVAALSIPRNNLDVRAAWAKCQAMLA